VPLLIGGATTSRAHTAIKIAPNYSGPVVYVPDASRAVGVVTKLLSIDNADAFKAGLAADYEKLRAQHAGKKGTTLVALEAARDNRFVWNGDAAYRPSAPKRPGLHVLRASIWRRWPISSTGRRSSRPGIWPAATRRSLTTPLVGATARAVFSDAQAMLDKVIVRELVERQRRLRHLPGQQRRRRHRNLCRRNAQRQR
jgi:5-methyltetrahydrofolate--homocysteine methyltransferase